VRRERSFASPPPSPSKAGTVADAPAKFEEALSDKVIHRRRHRT
jgi:hypothetical protein